MKWLNLFAIIVLIISETLCIPISNHADYDRENVIYGDEQNEIYTESSDLTYPSEIQKGLFTPAETTRETAKLETEGLGSKIYTKYDEKHYEYGQFRHAEPILDTISEHEKYGNSGGMFDGFSKALIEGYEAFSNLINKLIATPKSVAKSISRGITAQLDILGGKLVGLQ